MNSQLYSILVGPHISEKTLSGAELLPKRQYTFKVKKTASKQQIKNAVQEIFHVKVHAVNTVLVKGKSKMSRQIKGKRPDYKKAYVTLAPDNEIQLAPSE